MKILSLLSTLLFLTQISLPDAQAQPRKSSPHQDKGWVSVFAGTGSPLDLSYGFNVNMGREYFWQLSLQQATDMTLLGDDEDASLSNLQISYGISTVNRWGRLALALGPGLAIGQHEPDPVTGDQDRFLVANLGGNAQFLFTPIPEIGLGLTLSGNLNREISGYGLHLTFVFEGRK